MAAVVCSSVAAASCSATSESFDHRVERVPEPADLRSTAELDAGGQISGLDARRGARQGDDRPRRVDGQDDGECDEQKRAQALEQRGPELLLLDRRQRRRSVHRCHDDPAELRNRFVTGQDAVVPVVDGLGRAGAAGHRLFEDRAFARNSEGALGERSGIIRKRAPRRAVNDRVLGVQDVSLLVRADDRVPAVWVEQPLERVGVQVGCHHALGSLVQTAMRAGPSVSTLRLFANVPPVGVGEFEMPFCDEATTFAFVSKI